MQTLKNPKTFKQESNVHFVIASYDYERINGSSSLALCIKESFNTHNEDFFSHTLLKQSSSGSIFERCGE